MGQRTHNMSRTVVIRRNKMPSDTKEKVEKFKEKNSKNYGKLGGPMTNVQTKKSRISCLSQSAMWECVRLEKAAWKHCVQVPLGNCSYMSFNDRASVFSWHALCQ
ncbi:hypothetical protein RUM43_012092 [Polyplax serrata]|uniref:Uncharacterized protein n=1 Tax=Polyplax serrata TaxID=468196 RepID=A0AAN8Q3P3_POLSC